METTRSPQISIPKPCHEDWGKMTPDARGAFCSVCSKSVWDFTNKTPDEIKDILMQQSGKKICGRLRTDQLAQPAHTAQPVDIEIPFYLLQNGSLPRLTRFAAIALVTFGASLFNFTTTQGQVLGKMRVVEQQELVIKGEMRLRQEEPVDPVTVDTAHNAATPKDMEPLRGDIEVIPAEENNLPEQPANADTMKHCSGLLTENANEPEFIVGGMEYPIGDGAVLIPIELSNGIVLIPQQTVTVTHGYDPPAVQQIQNIVTPRLGNIDMSEQTRVGQMVVNYNEQPIIKLPPPPHPQTYDEVMQKQTKDIEQMAVEQYDQRQMIQLPTPPDLQPLVNEIPIEENVIEQEATSITENADAPKTTSAPMNEDPPLSTDGLLKVWPNPAVSVINLKYAIPAQSSVTIEVYDLNGKMLQRLATGEQHEGGEYTRTFDISALPSGAYLCTVRAEHSMQTVRFVKAEF